MSRYSFNGPYDRPAPEPHFIPGYTGHCPELAEQVGTAYSLATYFILQGRPDVANILSDIHPKHGKHSSQRGQSSKQGYKSRNGKEVGKDGYKKDRETEGDQKTSQEMDSHGCGSKETHKSRYAKSTSKSSGSSRKQWMTGESGHQEMKGSGGHNHPHLEVDIAFAKNMKQDSYDCGSESHKHLYLEGDLKSDSRQEMDDFGSESSKHSHSEGDKASGKRDCGVKNMDKFIDKQKDLFCKMISEVEKEKVKDTHQPCCNSLDFYKRTHCC